MRAFIEKWLFPNFITRRPERLFKTYVSVGLIWKVFKNYEPSFLLSLRSFMFYGWSFPQFYELTDFLISSKYSTFHDLYHMRCFARFGTICSIWRVNNTHGRVLLLVKLQSEVCNFAKSNVPEWVFFTFFKLNKWCQIAQSITYTEQYRGVFRFLSNICDVDFSRKQLTAFNCQLFSSKGLHRRCLKGSLLRVLQFTFSCI